ncbi:MAG: NYN domain-containing protein [Gemmatimonadales bacterium]
MNESLTGRAASPEQFDRRNVAGNAALLIDFDNVTMGIRSDLQHQLHELLNSEIIKGKVAVQRAYADWRRYPQYIAPLSEASIDLIFAPAFGSNKKNATDIRLAIDALELVFTRPEIGTFILLSGDSDFSSLVLKLKEYGKWVIGVGIRESASDLLMQNCDEYYSYNELTGLEQETDVEVRRHDPWKLVVEAVLRMIESEDTMRSDRLKQVMQQIDPHFDEKDAGFNRFSKFVLEAGHRNLLTLKKLQSGQYEIAVGPDANVPPDIASVTDEPGKQEPSRERQRPPRGKVERAAAGGGLALADGFALLKQVLVDLEAVAGNPIGGSQVRERMKEVATDGDDPIFEPRRFNRMLRQAHDASLIDLVKEGRVYKLTLNPDVSTEPESPPEEGPPARPERKKTTRPRAQKAEGELDTAVATEDGAAAEPKKKVARRAPRGRGGRRAAPKVEDGAAPAAVSVEGPAPTPTVAPARAPVAEEVGRPTAGDGKPAADARPASRSVRGRGSSRGRGRKPPTPQPAVSEPAPEIAPVLPRAKPTGRRSVRGRGSSRGRKPTVARSEVRTPDEPSKSDATGRAEKMTTSERRTPRTGGRPRHGKRVSDPDATDSNDGNAKSRGPRRVTPGSGRADDRHRAAATRTGTRGPGPSRRGAARDEQGKPATRTSRETQASGAFVAKRAEQANPKGGGIFKRMSEALSRAVRGEDQDD